MQKSSGRFRPTAPKISDTVRASYNFRARVWLYPGAAGWHFVSLSVTQSRKIRELFASEARGFGSIPVVVTIGETAWRTSLFPNSKSAQYMFAVKADVRKRERITAGDAVRGKVQIP